MIAPARAAALDILLAVDAGRADLPAAIASARTRLADARDRGLATEVATGVQRWRAALDHVIEHFARRKVDRLDSEILEILRLSLYQIRHLTRVPVAAVVDDAVAMAKRAGKQSAGGFVNAVLRSASRQRTEWPLPRRPLTASDRGRALDYLSIALSHPRWLAARWYDRLGLEAAEAWMAFNNAAGPLTLRVNRLRTTPDDLVARLHEDAVHVRPGSYGPDALIVEEGQPLRRPGVESGLFVVQGEASQLVALLASPAPGARVLDVCASPGGKTTALAASTGPQGLVIACDIRDRRMALLRRTVLACGASNVRLVQADARMPLPFSARFDRVLVDAPCSGTGVLRSDPDIRWRRQESDLPRLADTQLRILRHAAGMVAPGGHLVYATCSSEPEENDAVVSAFLSEAPEFIGLDARRANPAMPEAVVDEHGCLRTMPDRHGLEAFYGAVLVRRPGDRPQL